MIKSTANFSSETIKPENSRVSFLKHIERKKKKPVEPEIYIQEKYLPKLKVK